MLQNDNEEMPIEKGGCGYSQNKTKQTTSANYKKNLKKQFIIKTRSTLFCNQVDKGWSQKVQRSSLNCNHAYSTAATSESKYHKVHCLVVLYPMTSQTRHMEGKVQLHMSHLPKDKRII